MDGKTSLDRIIEAEREAEQRFSVSFIVEVYGSYHEGFGVKVDDSEGDVIFVSRDQKLDDAKETAAALASHLFSQVAIWMIDRLKEDFKP